MADTTASLQYRRQKRRAAGQGRERSARRSSTSASSTARPGCSPSTRLHLDGEHRIEDHLHRRRRRRPALSRLPDRPARRARRLPRDLLPAALRRTADRRAEGRVRLPRHPPHDGPRADGAVLQRLPPRRASDVGHGGLRRRAGGVLSRLDRHQRSPAARDRLDPHDRQDADARGDGVQIFDRPAVHVSEERPRLRRQFPAHVLRRAVRGIQGQSRCWRARSTAFSSCTPTTSRTPRPRRCASPARPAPIRSPASPPASPACGVPRTAAPTRRR